MKKIGFVDYYISEWHANNYPAWIEQANKELGTDYELKYVWAEKDLSPVDGITTDEWCHKMNALRCETIEELCEKSDAVIVLSPSNPEKHLGYAQKVLPFGKRTYIDKTFAPDNETAAEIYKIAEQYNTKVFSCSALRFADELKMLEGAQNLILTGGGGNFAEYIIHTVEMAVKLLESPVKTVKVENIGAQRICRAKTENGSQAVILYSPSMGFSISAQDKSGRYKHIPVKSDFFVNLIAEIIRFFNTGVLPFDSAQTLEVMRFRSALLQAENLPDNWIDI